MMLGYPSFSHLLDLRQQHHNHHHHQRYSSVPSPPVVTTTTSTTSAGAVSSAAAAAVGKSFTIDAILGLGDKAHHQGGDKPGQGHVGGGGGESASGKKTTKSKRVRTIFSPEQLERLEAEFERQQYMVGPERLYLAHALQLTEAQVKVWFQNRRIKWRKQHLELQQQRLAALKHQQQLQHQQLHGEDMDDSEVDSNSGDETGGFAPQNTD